MTVTSGSMRAVLYARVSSKDQEREGFSIPAQQRLLRQYAQEHSLSIVREFVDVETAKQAGRAGFGEMLTAPSTAEVFTYAKPFDLFAQGNETGNWRARGLSNPAAGPRASWPRNDLRHAIVVTANTPQASGRISFIMGLPPRFTLTWVINPGATFRH